MSLSRINADNVFLDCTLNRIFVVFKMLSQYLVTAIIRSAVRTLSDMMELLTKIGDGFLAPSLIIYKVLNSSVIMMQWLFLTEISFKICFFLRITVKRGCLCDNWKPSFFLLLVINWRTFSRRVTARWWHKWAKYQVLKNQNSRNRWCQIARRAIWKGRYELYKFT